MPSDTAEPDNIGKDTNEDADNGVAPGTEATTSPDEKKDTDNKTDSSSEKSIFPEGTRHRDGICRDLKKGAAMVAIKAKSKIVPMRIIGNYKLFSKMILRIGTPIDSEGKNKDELTDELYKAIEALK